MRVNRVRYGSTASPLMATKHRLRLFEGGMEPHKWMTFCSIVNSTSLACCSGSLWNFILTSNAPHHVEALRNVKCEASPFLLDAGDKGQRVEASAPLYNLLYLHEWEGAVEEIKKSPENALSKCTIIYMVGRSKWRVQRSQRYGKTPRWCQIHHDVKNVPFVKYIYSVLAV